MSADAITPGTSHVYGCCADGCTEAAVVKIDAWKAGWGWVFQGDYCRPHAREVRGENHDTREAVLHAG